MQSRIDFIRLYPAACGAHRPGLRLGSRVALSPRRTDAVSAGDLLRSADDTQLRIEAAALELFTTQGFHGTNIRDIAEKAASLKAQSIPIIQARNAFREAGQDLSRLHDRFSSTRRHAADRAFPRDGLKLLAMAIRSMVYDDAQQLAAAFIDILEFKNRHCRYVPRRARRIRQLLRPVLDR